MIATTGPVGFVGLGALGMVLAENLISSGLQVVGYQRASRTLSEIGGKNVASPAEVAEQCAVVMTCLPDGSALSQVVSGVDGLLQAKRAPTVVELSTIAVGEKEESRRSIRERGSDMWDCPISGTPVAIAAGGGTMFASGEPSEYEGIHALFQSMIRRVIYCGPFGFGMRYKCVANYLVSIHTCAAIEAVVLAEALGLDVHPLIEAISGSAASSYQFEARASVAARREQIRPMGTTRNLLKDVKIIANEAASAAFNSRLLDAATSLLSDAESCGLGDKDTANLIEMFDRSRR